MKHLLLTTIAAVLVVGCGESQESVPAPESKPVEPVAEDAQSEPSTDKAPEISIHKAAGEGNIGAVKQHLAAGTDVNVKRLSMNDELKIVYGETPLHMAVSEGKKETAELLIAQGADVNEKNEGGETPLNLASTKEVSELLIAEGADVNARGFLGSTPLDQAIRNPFKDKNKAEIADILRKHGGKTGEELKAGLK
ncbi:ankyrin repeat domain-containing protein [bacterium]|nr:ankyrin repeat domain-containing protein [bacterium]